MSQGEEQMLVPDFQLMVENSTHKKAAFCRPCLVLLLTLALAGQSSFAQASLGDWQNVQNLAVDSNISVKTKAGDKYHGELVGSATDFLTLDSDERGFPGRVTTRRQLRRQDVQAVRFVRPGASLVPVQPSGLVWARESVPESNPRHAPTRTAACLRESWPYWVG